MPAQAAATGRGPGAIRVLGIDPGTRITGYGIVDASSASGVHYVECGVLRASTELSIPARIHEICTGLREILAEFRPTHVSLESAFHGRNAMSALKLAEARGAIREVAIAQGLPVRELAPAAVKRSVGGKGRATKEQMVERVTLLCGLRTPPPSDAADALGLALACAHELLGYATLVSWNPLASSALGTGSGMGAPQTLSDMARFAAPPSRAAQAARVKRPPRLIGREKGE